MSLCYVYNLLEKVAFAKNRYFIRINFPGLPCFNVRDIMCLQNSSKEKINSL